MITDRAQGFLDEHRATLRQDIAVGSHTQLLDKTISKAHLGISFASVEEQEDWESGFAKVSENLAKTLDKLSEDLLCVLSWKLI